MKTTLWTLCLFLAVSSCLAKGKERVYQSASVLSMEKRKVGEREYGITAHRIVAVTANVYRIQAGTSIYEIQASGRDPLGAAAVGQTIQVSMENNRLFVLMHEGKKDKEYVFKIVGVYPAKPNDQ